MQEFPGRPRTDEYAGYYGSYIAAVEEPLLPALEREAGKWCAPLAAVPPDKEGYRYAPGKWSIREVVGHVIDAERMFSVRAMAFARGDRSHYPSFDENAYAAASETDRRTLADLSEELVAVRRATGPAAAQLAAGSVGAARFGQRERIHRQEPGVDHRRPLAASPERW